MNHIYFTVLPDSAGLAAEIATLDSVPHVYEIEPLGELENDPNVTDKKFPGNPTRSYRYTAPQRILREFTEWNRLSADELQSWRDRLTSLLDDDSAEIINWGTTTRRRPSLKDDEGPFSIEKKPSLRRLPSRQSAVRSGEAESRKDGVEDLRQVEVDHDVPFVAVLHCCEATLI
ncbi:NAD(+)--rifampin ADP-ribosyltransferase [Brevibacterium picturae]|uniref:Rifampin ADP-ribosyltransferase domain-containing protein n=1 Tax=Brevibacterium picturae TaxID=260553 RepID=A0ABN2CDN6_9MICO